MENRLRELRNEKGVSLRQCSKDTGISARTILRYEQGSIGHFENLKILADYYNVSIEYLLNKASKI